eukprot:scaffold59838_cov73-Phaeocystis_antarctica.AAC.5
MAGPSTRALSIATPFDRSRSQRSPPPCPPLASSHRGRAAAQESSGPCLRESPSGCTKAGGYAPPLVSAVQRIPLARSVAGSTRAALERAGQREGPHHCRRCWLMLREAARRFRCHCRVTPRLG